MHLVRGMALYSCFVFVVLLDVIILGNGDCDVVVIVERRRGR